MLWLLPIVRETASHSPSRVELNRALRRYGNEAGRLQAATATGSRPSSYGRAGSIAVASLALLPLAVFAHRRMWAAFVLGSMLATLAVTLLPFVFPHFADAISLSQARRIIGFCAAAVRARGRDAGARRLPAPVACCRSRWRPESACNWPIRATSARRTGWWTARPAG